MSTNLTTSSSRQSLSKMSSATALRHSHTGSHHTSEHPASPTLQPERRNSDSDLKPIPLTSEHLRGGDRPTTPKPPINTPESLSPDSYSPLLRSTTGLERSSHARYSSRGSAAHTDDLNPVTRRQQYVGGFESADPLFLPPRMEAQQARQPSSAAPANPTSGTMERPVAGEHHMAAQAAPVKTTSDAKKDEHNAASSLSAKKPADNKPDEHHASEPAGAAKVAAQVKPKVAEATTAVSETARKAATNVQHAAQAAMAPAKEATAKIVPERKSSATPVPDLKPKTPEHVSAAQSISQTAHKAATEAGHAAQKVAEPVKDKLGVKPASTTAHVDSHLHNAADANHSTQHPAMPSSATSETKPKETAPASRVTSKPAPEVSQTGPPIEQKPAPIFKTTPEIRPSSPAAETTSTVHMHPPRGRERSKRGSSASIERVDDLVPVTRSKSSAPPSPRPESYGKPPHHLDLAVYDVKPEPISTPKIMPELKPLVHAPNVTAPSTARPKTPRAMSSASGSSASAAAAITAALLSRAVSPKLDTTTAPHAADVYNPARTMTPEPDTKATRAPSPAPGAHATPAIHASRSTGSQHAHFVEQPNLHKTVQSTAVRRASGSSEANGSGTKTYKTFLIGAARQPQQVSTHLLTTKSPYFARLSAGKPSADNLPYPDIDDFAFKIWQRWLTTGKLSSLSGTGAEDFHALTHFLSVYCLAVRWEMEALQNQGTYSLASICLEESS